MSEPVFEIIEDLAPADLHEKARQVCMGAGWFFGHSSNSDNANPFWKMELGGDPVFSAIWQQARARCEELAGAPLRVIRQYANGHTYGLGGRVHLDDQRPGSYTLLYYPMAEWKEEWEGETVFHDREGEIGAAVRPNPNRAVFFDSRIPHAGRAPSRACPALRVTVAYKLEAVNEAPVAETAERASDGITTIEAEHEGTRRVYRVCVPAKFVGDLAAQRFEELGKTLRLPGFRPGKIPANVIEQRYGAKVRGEVANRLASDAADRIFAGGGLASTIEHTVGDGGAVELRVTVTHLPDLPDPHLASFKLDRVSATADDIQAVGLTPAAAREIFNDHFRQQVLDYLDSAYAFPIAPVLLENEFAKILRLAEAQLEQGGSAGVSKETIAAELRVIAERRVRLGAVVAEMARRLGVVISAGEIERNQQPGEQPVQTRARLAEDKVVERLIVNAQVSERVLSSDELREMVEA
jgi:SM-20-related protein